MSDYTPGQRVRRKKRSDPLSWYYAKLIRKRWSEIGQGQTWLVELESNGTESWWYESRFAPCLDYHVDV